ncbi:MAG: MipA/OmpV family protein [Deltaproteobacteria bacterium]|nr:MipA/OmpV family protein [Deltaproteobacteria bacterium]
MKYQIMRVWFLAGFSIFLLAAAVAPVATAADISIGGGAGMAPDYEGSDDYEFVPIPFARVAFDNGMFVTLQGLTAKANLIPSKIWRLGPMYNYRPSRSGVDNNKVDRLSNVSDANEVGGFGGFDYNNWFGFLEFLADVGEAHDGWLGTARGGYNYVASKSWTLSFGLSTTYASGDYMSTYFGVDGADAARSGLRTFNADEGLKDVAFDLGIGCKFTDHISGRFIGQYKMLINDADESSPVTNEGSQHQLFGGLLVVYTF